MGNEKTKLNICDHMLTSSTQLQNRSFHVVERTRTSSKCQKMKNARAKRAKTRFFIVKYANLWGSGCCRRRGCLSSLIFKVVEKPFETLWHIFSKPRDPAPSEQRTVSVNSTSCKDCEHVHMKTLDRPVYRLLDR